MQKKERRIRRLKLHVCFSQHLYMYGVAELLEDILQWNSEGFLFIHGSILFHFAVIITKLLLYLS